MPPGKLNPDALLDEGHLRRCVFLIREAEPQQSLADELKRRPPVSGDVGARPGGHVADQPVT